MGGSYFTPKYYLGQPVKAFVNIVVDGKVRTTPITVQGYVKEIIIGQDFLFGQLYYMYRLDSGEVIAERDLMARKE